MKAKVCWVSSALEKEERSPSLTGATAARKGVSTPPRRKTEKVSPAKMSRAKKGILKSLEDFLIGNLFEISSYSQKKQGARGKVARFHEVGTLFELQTN